MILWFPSMETDLRIKLLKDDVAEVKNITYNNIDTLLKRGEKVEVLLEKSEDLEAQASRFERTSSKLKNAMCRKNAMYALVVLVVILIFIILGVLISRPWRHR
jgi:uncharacterized membrane protein